MAALRSILAAERAFAGIVAAGIHKTNQRCDFRRIRVQQLPDPDVVDQLELMRTALPDWAPGKVADPVQRVRNLLFVAAIPDVFQMPIERYTPQLIFDRLNQDIPKDQLIKILYWIALHPNDGDDSAVDNLKPLGLTNGPSDMNEARYRSMVYALKLLGRLVGKIK